MVQNSANGNLSSCSEINEFQVVHALITQSLKGLPEPPKDLSYDENANNVNIESNNSQNNFISAICQTFNALNSANRKRVFPRSVKDFISQIRKSQEWCTSSTSKSNDEKFIPSPQNQSCVVRYASVLRTSNSQEKVSKNVAKRTSSKPSSNVQNKVLQFEKQANLVGSAAEQACATCQAVTEQPRPTASHTSCTEVCPGGTYYRTGKNPTTSSDQTSSTTPPIPEEVAKPQPPLSGRNLKRVPSERFQKMRRKVQKLMQHKTSTSEPEEQTTSVFDETTFLNSIRIPTPGVARQHYDSHSCLMLQLPDHILCQVFSLLDTRTLASVKCSCSDFKFIVNNFDIRATDSQWTKDDRYLGDPCKQCRHIFVHGDMSMCRYHPKRYYSDLPYGRSYWMCCLQFSKSAPGCKTGLHDNNWHE